MRVVMSPPIHHPTVQVSRATYLDRAGFRVWRRLAKQGHLVHGRCYMRQHIRNILKHIDIIRICSFGLSTARAELHRGPSFILGVWVQKWLGAWSEVNNAI